MALKELEHIPPSGRVNKRIRLYYYRLIRGNHL